MNNYYFTESKWYGPLPFIKLPIEEILNFPFGPSLIPEFAGMVKEEWKDFKFKGELTESGFIKTAVPVAEEINPETGKPFFDGLDEKILCKSLPVAEKNRKGNYTLEEQVKKKDEIIADQKRRIKIILQERENAIKNLKSKYAEEGKQTFSEEDINKVQEDIDSVNRGRVIDKFKLLGIPYLDETKQLLSEVYQVMTGFSQDDVWSDYDESVRRRVVEMQQKLENL